MSTVYPFYISFAGLCLGLGLAAGLNNIGPNPCPSYVCCGRVIISGVLTRMEVEKTILCYSSSLISCTVMQESLPQSAKLEKAQ